MRLARFALEKRLPELRLKDSDFSAFFTSGESFNKLTTGWLAYSSLSRLSIISLESTGGVYLLRPSSKKAFNWSSVGRGAELFGTSKREVSNNCFSRSASLRFLSKGRTDCFLATALVEWNLWTGERPGLLASWFRVYILGRDPSSRSNMLTILGKRRGTEDDDLVISTILSPLRSSMRKGVCTVEDENQYSDRVYALAWQAKQKAKSTVRVLGIILSYHQFRLNLISL